MDMQYIQIASATCNFLHFSVPDLQCKVIMLSTVNTNIFVPIMHAYETSLPQQMTWITNTEVGQKLKLQIPI